MLLNWGKEDVEGVFCEGFHRGSESSWVLKIELDFVWQTSWDIFSRESSVDKGRGVNAY